MTDFNVEGKPLRLIDLNVAELANHWSTQKLRTSQGKVIQPLHAGHLKVLADPARYKVLAAGRRWAKTLLSSLIATAVLMQPRRRVWIVAPTYDLGEKAFREIRNILVTQLKLVRPGKPGGGQCRTQKGDFYIATPWHSVLEVKSLENPDSLVGEALDLVIVDEAALTENLYDIWTQLLKPTLLDKEGSALFISTPRGRNGFYKMFLMGQKGIRQRTGQVDILLDDKLGINDDMTEWSSFRQTSYDNPLLASTPEKSKEEIDKSYREAVNAGKVIQFKQEYLADFEAVADTCFSGFIQEATEQHPHPNVVDYKWHPDEGGIVAAMDHNFARPASTLFAQVNKFNDVIIFDECFTPKTTPFQQGQQVLNKEEEYTKLAHKIWGAEGKHKTKYSDVRVKGIVADISGEQRMLNGRSAWDDVEAAVGYKPVGLKQDREVGANMIRMWLQYPYFDQHGKPALHANGEQKKVPTLFF